MANWIDDPQEREEVEKVTEELKLPIFKANAKGKFRPWLKECWNKLEDYLINLKELANSKENFIKDKKTGFNLDKTNNTENDSNKLFTAKGALDLFNRLTTAINTAVENMKNVLRVDIAKKIDKTSISDSLTSTSQTTVLSSAGAKDLEDKKLNISDAWRFYTKVIGSTTDTTDLNDIIEPGDYISVSAANKWLSLPFGANPAFHLTVESIGSKYRVQTLRHHNINVIFRRVNAIWDRWAWSAWERIDGGDRLLRTIEGDLEGLKRGTNGIFLSSGNTLNFSSHNNLYHFNYHAFPGSKQISEFYLNNGDSKGGMADFYAKNITARGGNLVIDSQSDVVWSNLRLMTRDGFWRLEAHPKSTSTGNRRCNLIFHDNETKKDIIVAFPDVGANGETLAYRSWITWGNVSGKPSSFPPSSHTHDDRYYTEAEINSKFNSKHLEIAGKEYGGILNNAGAKTAGKTYFDNNTKKLFLCKNNNSDTSANVANYIALDNNSLLERLENLKTKQKIIWEGNSSNITFTLPDKLVFSDISMLVIVGDAPVTLLSSQITKLNNNSNFPIFYDNGTNEDNYAEFTKLSNNSARLTCRHSAANQFRGWRNIAIIY